MWGKIKTNPICSVNYCNYPLSMRNEGINAVNTFYDCQIFMIVWIFKRIFFLFVISENNNSIRSCNAQSKAHFIKIPFIFFTIDMFLHKLIILIKMSSYNDLIHLILSYDCNKLAFDFLKFRMTIHSSRWSCIAQWWWWVGSVQPCISNLLAAASIIRTRGWRPNAIIRRIHKVKIKS